MKTMKLRQFIDDGYLQEVNRQFLHPLGLAIALQIDDATGEAMFHSIWDCRDDPHGITFHKTDLGKAQKVSKLQSSKGAIRLARLGYIIQSVDGEVDTV